MKCAETTVIEEQERREEAHAPARKPQAESNKGVITLPMGLLGFEKVKHYTLLGSAEEAPFLWLQMVEDPSLAFLVISPSVVVTCYEPDISDEDAKFLDLVDPKDALIFNIVTVHQNGEATVNLKGPIVVNRRTLVGKQVVPLNAARYALQHPVAANSSN